MKKELIGFVNVMKVAEGYLYCGAVFSTSEEASRVGIQNEHYLCTVPIEAPKTVSHSE